MESAPRSETARLVFALRLGAALTIVVAVALGLVVEPFLFAIAGLGIIDLVLARAFATGRLGPRASRRPKAAADAAVVAELDPSFSPHTRED